MFEFQKAHPSAPCRAGKDGCSSAAAANDAGPPESEGPFSAGRPAPLPSGSSDRAFL